MGLRATFEGQGFEISDFVINASTTTQQGLFREATGATFQNIVFDNVSINGSYHLGLLAGYLEVGTTTATNITASNITITAQAYR